eukprot:1216139-Rhodomonas_salina.1
MESVITSQPHRTAALVAVRRPNASNRMPRPSTSELKQSSLDACSISTSIKASDARCLPEPQPGPARLSSSSESDPEPWSSSLLSGLLPAGVLMVTQCTLTRSSGLCLSVSASVSASQSSLSLLFHSASASVSLWLSLSLSLARDERVKALSLGVSHTVTSLRALTFRLPSSESEHTDFRTFGSGSPLALSELSYLPTPGYGLPP